MTDIAETIIGTNDVPTIANGVNLYKSFHFPDGWSRHFDSQWWDTTKEFDIHVLEGRVGTRFAWNIEFGLAGPKWAGRMNLMGSASEATLHLDILEDDFKAGMLLGANFNIQFALNLQRYGYGAKFWEGQSWHDILNIEKEINADLLGLAFMVANVLKAAGKLIPGVKKVLVCVPSGTPHMIANNSGIKDYIDDSTDIGWLWEGLTISPDIQLKWDLVEICKTIGVTLADLAPPLIPVAETISEIADVAGWLAPSIATGPVIGVVMEVHLKISGLTGYTAGGERITTSNLRDDGAMLAADVRDGVEHVPAIHSLGVDFTHRAAISFEVGWHVTLSWVKILSLSLVKTKHASDFGIEMPISEQYKYELKNTIGGKADDAKISFVDSWILYEG